MKNILNILLILLVLSLLSGCGNKENEDTDTIPIDVFRLLMEAEDLSGMADKTKTVITEAGSLNLPFEYHGVEISYRSRNPLIISDLGVVTLPTECWIESRDQQGNAVFKSLNDNWPIVLDVTLTYQGQTRTTKLLFVVAPQVGFTCNKYLG
jgi:hypothetical protein